MKELKIEAMAENLRLMMDYIVADNEAVLDIYATAEEREHGGFGFIGTTIKIFVLPKNL